MTVRAAEQAPKTSPTISPGRWFAVILLRYFEEGCFWERDAGLFFEGFRANGIDTRLVALGEPSVDESRGLILASQAQMEQPDWWRQWGLEGVALYSWALPKFSAITRALQAASVKVVIILDTDGVVLPQVWPMRFIQIKYYYAKSSGSRFPWLSALLRSALAATKVRYRGVLAHLEHASLVALPSNIALQRYRRFLQLMNRPDLTAKLAVLYHPVSTIMTYNLEVRKEPLIIAVGGWERLVKGGELLVRVLAEVLQQEPAYRARIIGSGQDLIHRWVRCVHENARARIQVAGPVQHDRMPLEYGPAQICINASTSESFGIACAEALCCGCAVVGHGLIGSMHEFCGLGSGTLAATRSVGNFTDALLAEIAAWRAGEREPTRISDNWNRRLHADKVTLRLMELCSRSAK